MTAALDTPAKAGRRPPAWSQVTIVAPDGAALALRRFAPPRAASSTALVLPGGGLDGGLYTAFARLVAAQGIEVLVLDPRGHGLSQGARGHVDRASRYAEDLAHVLRQTARERDLPLFALAHSCSAAILLNALALTTPPLSGVAMLAPSFSDDGELFPSRSALLRRLARFRYFLGVDEAAPARAEDAADAIRFDFPAYLAARLLRIGRARTVLTFPARGDGARFGYVADAVAGMGVGGLERRMRALDCPLFLATGGADPYVHSEAVRTVLPWALRPPLPLTSLHDADADHYTVLLRSVRALTAWLRDLAP